MAGSKDLRVSETLPSRKVIQAAAPAHSLGGGEGELEAGAPTWAWAVLHTNSLFFSFPLGLNPSEPLSSSTQWAGHQSRSFLHPCGHPHLGAGPCSPASSGAESLIPA